MIQIREEIPEDVDAIRDLNHRAFGQTQEGKLVDTLRENGGVWLSVVATLKTRVVGHALFSPVTLCGEGRTEIGAGLGPMAVLPDHQRQGIGSKLIDYGTRWLKKHHCPFIVVLGHPDYYPHFGFIPAGQRRWRCEWDAPEEAFMVLVLDEKRIEGVSGLIKYREEFSTEGTLITI